MKIKLIKTVIVAVVFILIVIGAFFLNIYLKENNLFLYSTGTNDKSLFNSTWGMSPNEVKRANNSNIEYSSSDHRDDLFVCIPPDDISRYKPHPNEHFSCYIDEVYLFGSLSEVWYLFFKDKFYKYEISIPVYGYSDVEEILQNLKERFGADYIETLQSGGNGEGGKRLIYKWNMKKQKIELLVIPSDEENPFKKFAEKEENPFSKFIKKYELHITAIYLPIFNGIDKELKEQESSYF